MEVKTINPILVNPEDANVNGYVGGNTVNLDLKGKAQDVNVGDFVVKGTNPVFIGDKEASRNEFLFDEPVEFEGEKLTPMDEFLYSNASGKDRLEQEERRKQREERRRARQKANQTSPGKGEPSASEQDAKAKEGKFWDVVKGGWSNFTKSPSGQVILDSATNYISNKLGGNSFTQPGGETGLPAPTPPAPTDEPMSQTMKIALIGGGVLLVGIILYNVLSKK
jgi:hypothetical protein